MGFSVPPRLRLERWALTPPFHPCHRAPRGLAAVVAQWRFVFCGTVRRDTSRYRLPRVSPALAELRGIAPCGVRTFLRWLAPAASLRSPGTGGNTTTCCWATQAGAAERRQSHVECGALPPGEGARPAKARGQTPTLQAACPHAARTRLPLTTSGYSGLVSGCNRFLDKDERPGCGGRVHRRPDRRGPL